MKGFIVLQYYKAVCLKATNPLDGNVNALFLWNAGGQNVEFSGDNSAALNALLAR
jgi:hypothetical protein